MKKIYFVIMFLIGLNNFLNAQVYTPKEWCPKGTWWSYKRQSWGPHAFRYREHEIYIYKKDTVVKNRTVKKIDIYHCNSDMNLDVWDHPFDSFLEEPRYSGYVLMYMSQDSVYAWFHAKTFSWYFDNAFDDFIFLYKFHLKSSRGNIYLSDSILYNRIQYDSAKCFKDSFNSKFYKFRKIYRSDKMYVYDTPVYKYRYQNKDIEYSSYKSVYRNNNKILKYYSEIYNYLVPDDYIVNSGRDYKDTFTDRFDSLYCYCDISSYTWRTRYYDAMTDDDEPLLWCYFQGGEVAYIDRHYKGFYNSGCEDYVKKIIVDKVSALDISTKKYIMIYPNPARNHLYIEGLDEKEYLTNLYDAQGKLLLSSKIAPNQKNISIENLSDGLLYIFIYNPQGELLHSQKFIKN